MRTKTKHNLLLTAVCVGMSALAVQSPVVSNARISQDPNTRIVTIKYDLENSDAIVTMELQTNSTPNATEGWIPIGGKYSRSLAGAVNRKIAVSNDLEVIWFPDVDWPNGFAAAGCLRVAIKAWPTNSPPDYWAIDISGGKCHFYYPDEDSLPGGIDSDKWRMEQMLMRRIPARNVVWQMGSPEGEIGRDTSIAYGANMEMLHNVKLTHDYYIGVFEVTQYQMEIARDGSQNFSKFTNAIHWATRPAEYNDFADRYHTNTDPTSTDPAVRHQCETWKLTGIMRSRSGLDYYLDLPTEAQWEFACRAGSTSALYDGNNLASATGADANLSKIARYKYTSAIMEPGFDCDADSGTARVGSYKPNAWGLYDMLGNVSEMCLDCYGSHTNCTDEITVDPLGPKFCGTAPHADGNILAHRVTRGGNYSSNAAGCRNASRTRTQIWSPNSTVGARMCYTLIADDADTIVGNCVSQPLETALSIVSDVQTQAEGSTTFRCAPYGGRITVR